MSFASRATAVPPAAPTPDRPQRLEVVRILPQGRAVRGGARECAVCPGSGLDPNSVRRGAASAHTRHCRQDRRSGMQPGFTGQPEPGNRGRSRGVPDAVGPDHGTHILPSDRAATGACAVRVLSDRDPARRRQDRERCRKIRACILDRVRQTSDRAAADGAFGRVRRYDDDRRRPARRTQDSGWSARGNACSG